MFSVALSLSLFPRGFFFLLYARSPFLLLNETVPIHMLVLHSSALLSDYFIPLLSSQTPILSG